MDFNKFKKYESDHPFFFRPVLFALGITFFVIGINFYYLSVFQIGILLLFLFTLLSLLRHSEKYNRDNGPVSKKKSDRFGSVKSFFLKLKPFKKKRQTALDAGDSKGPSTAAKRSPEKKKLRYVNLFFPIVLILISVFLLLFEIDLFKFFLYADPKNRGVSDLIVGFFLCGASFILTFFTIVLDNRDPERAEGAAIILLLKVARIASIFSGLSVIIGYMGLPVIEKIAGCLLFALFVLIFFETMAFCIRNLFDGIEREKIDFEMHILSAFFKGGNPFSNLFSSLEGKTGISLRSSWMIKIIRKKVPVITVAVALLTWLLSTVVQINLEEEGLLYTFGKTNLQKTLQPGLHLKLPWPVQTVKKFPVYQIKNFTVGYESEKKGDFLWTTNHSGREYKLLLGDGRELVSINMQVFYKIGDLRDFSLVYSNPVDKLQAEAYRLLLNATVTEDLDTLLTKDRVTFSRKILGQLRVISKEQRIGIDVVDVALTSIHPPIEIASEYQRIVSADIMKKTIITDAQTYALSSVPKMQMERNSMVNSAQVESLKRVSSAYGESFFYRSQWDAYRLNRRSYRLWKFLDMMERALPDKKVYLLDRNINLSGGGVWLDLRNSESTGNYSSIKMEK